MPPHLLLSALWVARAGRGGLVDYYMDTTVEAVPLFLTVAMLLMRRQRSGSSCMASGSEADRKLAMMVGTKLLLHVTVAEIRLCVPTLLLALIDSSMALVTLVTLLGLFP